MKTKFLLLFITIVFLFVSTVEASRKSYMLRKGSPLEYHHKRILHSWRKAYKHHKPRNADRFEDLLKRMDSMIRPRFG